MLSTKQTSEIHDRVRYFVDKGNDVFDTDLPMPVVLFKKRGSCAGTAWYLHLQLDFNATLMLDNWDEYMNNVIPHEVAHLLKEHKYGYGKGRIRSAHGTQWQAVMRGIGATPSRTHNMDTSLTAIHRKKYMYTCTVCNSELVVGPRVHQKMNIESAGYGHAGCADSRIVFNRELGKLSFADAALQKATDKSSKKPANDASNTPPKKSASKISIALQIYKHAKKRDPEITRQTMISLLADILKIERKSAAGYYQNCKKRV